MSTKLPNGMKLFHITRGWHGEPCPEHLNPLIVRVLPAIPYGPKDSKPDCPHTLAYPIFDRLQKGIGTAQKVCECVGNFVEKKVKS